MIPEYASAVTTARQDSDLHLPFVTDVKKSSATTSRSSGSKFILEKNLAISNINFHLN